MKRLIFNADDFGFTRDVNEGIVEAHRGGVLTATTLMANGAAFDHAVVLARETPSLDVGVHLVMVQGESVAHPGRAMPATLSEVAQSLLSRSLDPYEEAAAQVRKIVAAGIQPSHIDTHKHTHLFPPVLAAVSRVAREFGIRWVRRPFDFGVQASAGITTQAIAAGMKIMSPHFENALDGLRMPDHFAGFQMTGTLDTELMVKTLRNLPDGLTEFMCHPGHCGPELQASPTRLKESRGIELAALISPETRAAIEELKIRLVNYQTADTLTA